MAAQRTLPLMLTIVLALLVLPILADDRGEDSFTEAELEGILAPVALYPDALLTQVLIAATYPLEVVEAARFVRDRPELAGTDAVTAAAGRGWDSSVQALTAFPDVLLRMSEELGWTQDLGEAFLAQENAVMAAVQRLRGRADVAGALDDGSPLRLERQQDHYVVAPSRDALVYIPWYDTDRVYGEWPAHARRPVNWNHSSRMSGATFLWGPPIHLHSDFYPRRLDWHRRGIIVVQPGLHDWWQHDVHHRRGVHYRHPGIHPHHFQQRTIRHPGALDTRTAAERLRHIQRMQQQEQRASRIEAHRQARHQHVSRDTRADRSVRTEGMRDGRRATRRQSSDSGSAAQAHQPARTLQPSSPSGAAPGSVRRAPTAGRPAGPERSYRGSAPHQHPQ